MQASTLEAVRLATSANHRLLEAAPGQARLLDDGFSLDEYRATLQRLYGFYEPLSLAFGSSVHAARWHSRVVERTAFIRQDLLELGMTIADLEAVPRCGRFPAFDTPDHVLGAVYVLEGSTLGGRVIYKRLKRTFGARTDISFRFFAGDGAETAAHWRGFCAELDAGSVAVDDVCTAACEMFDALAAWLGDSVFVPATLRK